MKNRFTIFLISISLMGVLFMTSCKKSDNETNPQPTQDQIIENNIKAALDSVIANTHVPGLVAGIWAPNEGINLVYTAGEANLETHAPMSADMIFRIGSNTKTFTVTVLLQLVDEGLISLNEKLSTYLPNFPRADEVTIEMLTNMRSGIISYSELVPFLNTWYTDPTHFWTTDEMIALAANADTVYLFDPGTSYSYSNTNTIILQKIIENVTGVSLEAHIRSRIINPLGLINTVYLVGGTQLPGYHSSGYWYNYYMPELPELTELLDVSWAAAAGSMISDIFELKTYAKALVDGTFLSDTLQQRRLACHDMGRSVIKYGMGIFEYKGFYGHNGGIHGFSSLMIYSSQRNCTIIIWYNCYLEDSEPTDLITIIPKLIYPEL